MPENAIALERVPDLPADRHIYRLPEGTEGAIERLAYSDAVPAIDIAEPSFNGRRTAIRLSGAPEGDVMAVLMKPESILGRIDRAVDRLFGRSKLTANMGIRDLKEALQMALEMEDEDHWPWVVDVVPGDSMMSGSVVYERDDMTLVRRSYSFAEGGAITLSGDMEPVRRETTWHPVTVVTTNQQENAMTTMQERVAAIVANERSQFTKADAEYLAGLPEDRIASIEAKLKEAPTVAETAQPQTFEQMLAAAPSQYREAFEFGQTGLTAHREGLVKRILDAKGDYTEDDLKAMSTKALEKTASLVKPAVDFRGQGAPRTVGEPTVQKGSWTPPTFGGLDPMEPTKAA